MKTTILEKLKLPHAVKLFGLRQMLRFWNLPEWGKLIVGFLILLFASAFLWPLTLWLWGMSLGKTLLEYYVLAFSKIPYIDSLPNFTISMLVAIPLLLLTFGIMWKIIEYQKRFGNWLSPNDDDHATAISRYVKQVAAGPNGYERVQAVVKPYAERYRKQQKAKVERTNAWDISPIWFSTAIRTSLLIIVIALGYIGLTNSDFQQKYFQPRVCAILNIDPTTCDSAKEAMLTPTAGGSPNTANWAVKLLELRAQAVVLALSALVALVLWIYRDLNKRREQETAHRETLFSEHKQLIEWAAQSPASTEAVENKQRLRFAPRSARVASRARPSSRVQISTGSATNAKTSESEKPVLQAAAIYQLAPFIRDRNASLYQRATLETLRALNNADMPEKSEWFAQWQKAFDNFSEALNSPLGTRLNSQELESARRALLDSRAVPITSAALRAVGTVLREYPTLLYHREFKPGFFSLWAWKANGLHFTGCNLRRAKFHGADVSGAQFHGADVVGAEFHGANGSGANFRGAIVIYANFHGANLVIAQFHGADVNGVEFYGANMKMAEFFVVEPENAFPRDDKFTQWTDAAVPEPRLQSSPEWAAWLSERIQRGAISVAALDNATLEKRHASNELRAAAIAAQAKLVERGLQPTLKDSLPGS